MIVKKTAKVRNHTVEVWLTKEGYITLLVDGRVQTTQEKSRRIKLRLALAARRLWYALLEELPPGGYLCLPFEEGKNLLKTLGWVPYKKWWMVYFHQIPKLPSKAMKLY